MSTYLDQLHKSLRSNGYSDTNARRIVFEAMHNKEPINMNELVKQCNDRIDRASVYRTVDLFERIGVLKRIQSGWKYKLELSDDFQDHHHHLTCLKCGKVVPIEEDRALEAKLAAISRQHNFKMTDHQLEIQGTCQDCTNLKDPGRIRPGL